MRSPYGQMVGMQAVVAAQWLETMASVFNWYSDVLDPRPDLSRRARDGRSIYAWWW